MVTFAPEVTPAMSTGAPRGRPKYNTQTFRRRQRRRRAPERRSSATELAESGGGGAMERRVLRLSGAGTMDARQQTGRLAERVVENKEPVCQRRGRVNQNQQAQTPTPGCPAARQGKVASSQVKAAVTGRRSPRTSKISPAHKFVLVSFRWNRWFCAERWSACVWRQ